jgi:hypothetical protein
MFSVGLPDLLKLPDDAIPRKFFASLLDASLEVVVSGWVVDEGDQAFGYCIRVCFRCKQ